MIQVNRCAVQWCTVPEGEKVISGVTAPIPLGFHGNLVSCLYPGYARVLISCPVFLQEKLCLKLWKLWASLMAQWVKDPEPSLLWLRPPLLRGFDLWPGNFHMPWARRKEYNKMWILDLMMPLSHLIKLVEFLCVVQNQSTFRVPPILQKHIFTSFFFSF